MNADDGKKLNKIDLDKLHSDTITVMEASSDDEIEDSTKHFNTVLDEYERYLDVRQKELKQKNVAVKSVVADDDAVQATLKTYHAINDKIQQQIADGAELSSNDIRLLVEMMRVLNGDK